MKKSVYLFFSIPILISLLLACNNSLQKFDKAKTFSETEAKDLVSQLNGHAIIEIDKAFTTTVAIKSVMEDEEDDDDKFWLITFKKEGTKDYTIDLGIMNDFSIPNKIQNARVTYLRDQLILDDLDSDFLLNFYVENENSVNRTPYLNTIEVKSLGVSTTFPQKS